MREINWPALAEQYRRALLDDVMPFWLRHSLDVECGGYLHYLDADGSVYCTDKMMWMQGREVWMLSRLYNSVERRPEWLAAARLGADFMRRHGRDEDGAWYFLLDRTGAPIKAAANIYSDFFAVMGLSEYAAAAAEGWALDLAVQTFWQIIARRDNPKGRYNKSLPRPDVPQELAFQMMLLHVARQLDAIAPDARLRIVAVEALERIVQRHVEATAQAVFENVWADGTRPDSPAGRLLSPGHAIEAMAFVIDAAGPLGAPAASERATEALRWMLERGWDREYGGLYYFLDIAGRPPEQLEWSMKLWWPHAEALNALLAILARGHDEDLLAWYERVAAYTWSHFPDPQHGEWFGYLDRAGQRTHNLKGCRWKGCFHVPRALLNCWQIAERMSA